MERTDSPKLIAAAVVLAIGGGMGVSATDLVPSAFVGDWRVAGVAVPDTGVQALTNDDPSLMGRAMSFAPARLAWDRPSSTGDDCAGPRFDRLSAAPPFEIRPQLRKLGMREPVAYTVRCQSGSWGLAGDPGIYLGADGALALPWYDGGLLKLVRR